MSTVPLGEICNVQIGRTPPRSDPRYWGGSNPWASISDLNQGLLITRTKEGITEEGAHAGKLVQPGTVLISFKLSIGKVSIAGIPLYTNEAIAALPIKYPSTLDARYLLRYLESLSLEEGANRAAMGRTLNKKTLSELPVPLPPLDEQRRIAAILDKADAIRQKRRQAIAHLDTLTQSIFRDRFLQDRQWESAPLGSISEISSGITKGRKTSSALTQSAPYLAVANVQDGKLDLTNLKSIEVSDEELEKYKLQGDDLVLTEGGDPDKLGRGTIWRDELPVCLHQNHIFRIRLPKDSNLEVEFLSAYIASWPAKAYFLRSAKQTTGIASINKTQLSKVPIPLPPIIFQREFTKLSQQVRIQIAEHERALELADQSFSSLQSRAFRGEL
ncbi:restriction endonuclease subunit S [Brevibacterium linens]|uniref:Type I restriction enzyme, S subunit n=1 Tax=Brevibacterium linens ATCC 9172 TaxID=1255617 RepID=A0A2H1ILP9_BRELN|nr:restriction endonuclease subunit S [Brevibacterium linens]KAB1948268.1 restriction endonuclease subunit S [Brevibacterium linens ATCC 9172]SMX76094.1 type I restriction enzyme, S subunit [Brevibacterium linens ATCC 9172]